MTDEANLTIRKEEEEEEEPWCLIYSIQKQDIYWRACAKLIEQPLRKMVKDFLNN